MSDIEENLRKNEKGKEIESLEEAFDYIKYLKEIIWLRESTIFNLKQQKTRIKLGLPEYRKDYDEWKRTSSIEYLKSIGAI